MLIKRHNSSLLSICLALLLLFSCFNPAARADTPSDDSQAAIGPSGVTGGEMGQDSSSQSAGSGEAAGQGDATGGTSPAISGETDNPEGTAGEAGQPPNAPGDDNSLSGGEAQPASDAEEDSINDDPEAPLVSDPELEPDPTQEQAPLPELPILPVVSKVTPAGSVIDPTVTMAAGYRNVRLDDNTWEISMTSGTLKGAAGDDLSADIVIEGLPAGLAWTATNAGANSILISVYGPASNLVLEPAAASITVKGSAVSEPESDDCAPLPVSIQLDGSIPDAIAVDPAGNTLYILIKAERQVIVVDASSDSIRSIIKAGENDAGMDVLGIARGLLALLG